MGVAYLGASYVQPQTDKPQEMFVSVRTFGELSARHVLRAFGWSEIKYLLENRICRIAGRCSKLGRFEEERKIVFYHFFSVRFISNDCFDKGQTAAVPKLVPMSLFEQWAWYNCFVYIRKLSIFSETLD